MAKKDVVVKADRVRGWRKLWRFVKISILLLLLILIIIYFVLKILFDDGSFIVSLERNEMLYSGLAMYESLNDPTPKRILRAKDLQFMDNISIKWLPNDKEITAPEGSHNGDNYIAYTFYMENQGKTVLDYWYYVYMDDVIKHADEALRIMIYVNDKKTVYAKGNRINGKAEKNTVKFRNDDDGTIILEHRKNMRAGDLDKITVIIWIEGDDPDCVDALIGGHVRLHMKLTEEHTEKTIRELEWWKMAKSKKEEKKKRLRLLLLLLFVTVVMLATSTYAWFTANRTVSIAPIDVYVEASSGLQISTDAKAWKTIIQNSDITSPGEYTTHKNMKPTTLVPVSTIGERDSGGYMKFFRGVVEGASSLGGEMGLTANATPEESTFNASTGNFTNGDAPYYIAFDIFLKVDKSSGEDVYLDAGSGVIANTSSGTDKHLQYASRYAFVQESTNYPETTDPATIRAQNTGTSAIIIEPNYDAHTDTSVTAASNYYSITTTAAAEADLKSGAANVAPVNYVGVKAAIPSPIILVDTNPQGTINGTYFEVITNNATHVKTNTAYSYNENNATLKSYTGNTLDNETNHLHKIFHLAQGITKFRVYMWVEGQDVDCENNASGANLTYKLGLTLGPES